MEIKNLDQNGIEEILLEVGHGSLGTVDREGNPYVVAVSFSYADGTMYMFFDFERGEKIENMQRNPNVCFEVTSVDPPNSMLRSVGSTRLSSVIFRGTVEKVVDEAEKLHVYGEAMIESMHKNAPEGVVYKITPTHVTGKSYIFT